MPQEYIPLRVKKCSKGRLKDVEGKVKYIYFTHTIDFVTFLLQDA